MFEGVICYVKRVDEQVESMENRGREKKASNSRDMLSTLDGKVAKLEGSMGDMKETFEEVYWPTTELESRQDQLKNQMAEALSDNMDVIQCVFNIAVGELIDNNDALKALLSTLNEHIEELNICKASLGNGVMVETPKPSVDVPKPKEFNRTWSIKDVDNFFWGIE